MPDNKKLIPMADNSIDAIQARQTAQSEGRKSYVTPDTRGGGDVGLSTNTKLSLNTGINLNPESYGARLGAKYQGNNFSGSVDYSKPLSSKPNVSGSVSYGSEKGYGSVDYNSENKEINDTVYSDRLYQWDYEKYNKLCEKHFGDKGQYFSNRNPKNIENFLKGKPKNTV